MSSLCEIRRGMDPECTDLYLGYASSDVFIDVLTFRDNSERGKTGVISMYMGAAVFIDRRHTIGDPVEDGESWICRSTMTPTLGSGWRCRSAG